MEKSYSESYAAAGVDITAGYRSVELMKQYVARTMNEHCIGGLGGFGGLFELDCTGYKYINVPLPLELLGKDDVCIRFSAANKKAGGKEDGEFDDQIITTGEIAFSYIGVRYNK